MKKLFKISLMTACFLIFTACSTPPPDTGNRASIGNPNAKVLIEEFSDFQCPACAEISPQLEKIAENNSEIARLEFYHFPLTYHQYSFKAAEAAECANDQDKFWEFMNIAFKNQDNLTEDNLKSFASNLGLNMETFNTCLDSGQKKARINSDINEGTRHDLGYTPSIYVNGTLVQWNSVDEFEKYIKSLAQ